MSSIKFTGVMADLQASGISQAKINKAARTALYIAADEFFQDPQGFQLRFSPRAYDVLGLSKRSGYTSRFKIKIYGGRDLPNVSARGPNNKHKGDPHLRDLLKVRGTGYNLTTTAKQGVASIKMSLPGARKQNQYGQRWSEPYGRELFNMKGAQQWQTDKIMKRAFEIFQGMIWEEFNRTTPVFWGA